MARWLSVDPGESVGWALWDDHNLVDSGTGTLWAFGDSVFRAIFMDPEELEFIDDELAHLFGGIEWIVCEDFKIYPWEAEKGSLNWDGVRTARLIGALQLVARNAAMGFFLQGAKIKESAVAAGAEHLFTTPLYECRHGNDAIMHGVYWWATNKNQLGKVTQNEEDGNAD